MSLAPALVHFPGDLKPSLRLFLEGLQILTTYGLSSHMRYAKTNIYVEWKNISPKRQLFLEALVSVAKILLLHKLSQVQG